MPCKILGIETSCDETAAAVYDSVDGILSSKLFSQVDLHKEYGGVVPEIASRAHIQKIKPIVELALSEANTQLKEIDVVAVTNKPGLAGSLLIGVCFAKALAYSLDKKIVGIDHTEGHIFSPFLEHQVPSPHICLTASGGHTSLFLVSDFGKYEVLGDTLDDAAGEAFDKVAKLIDLPYPGGPVIEKLAREVEFEDFFKYTRGKPGNKSLNFSFSGLKTAVLYDLVKRDAYDLKKRLFKKTGDLEFQKQVASSLLVCITDIFKNKILLALKAHPEVKAVSFVGGVACNKFIRESLKAVCSTRGVEFFTPSPKYCTDNAAMIAFVGNYKAKLGKLSDLNLDIFD